MLHFIGKFFSFYKMDLVNVMRTRNDLFLSVEFTHEIMRLPRPPRILRDDIKFEWRCDRPTLAMNRLNENGDALHKFAFFDNLGKDDAQEFSIFETKFKSFLYGGVSVQRIIPFAGASKSKRERRTLWLMLPEVGSLQLGLVAKTSDDSHEGVAMSQKMIGIDDQSEYSTSLRSQQDSDEIMRFDGDDIAVGDSDNVTVVSAIADACTNVFLLCEINFKGFPISFREGQGGG